MNTSTGRPTMPASTRPPIPTDAPRRMPVVPRTDDATASAVASALRSRAPRRLRTLLHVAAATAYALFAIAIVWGIESGSPPTPETGFLAEDGAWSFAAAVALMVGGVSLLDADVAPVASVGLSAGMLGALAFAPLMHGSRLIVGALLAVAVLIAWMTREERRELCASPDAFADDA